jgi:hypothetical protein
MSFRRNTEKERALHKWIARNKDMLVKSGIPDFVYSDKLTWFRFLEPGGWHHEPGWSVNMLSSHEAAVFSDFIAGEYGEEEYCYLLQNLADKRFQRCGQKDPRLRGLKRQENVPPRIGVFERLWPGLTM